MGLRFVSAGFLYPDPAWKERFMSMAGAPTAADEVKSAVAAMSLEELQAEHFRLFGPDPACPLELSYYLSENPFEQARIMAELAGFHKAFGVESEAGLRPDTLSICLEFLAYLRLKQLNAGEKGLTEGLDVTTQALRSAVREFILPGLKAFEAKLRERSQNPIYLKLAELALKEVQACA